MNDDKRPRTSIFTGLLLILLGVIFLIHRFYPEFGLGHVIRVYWPLLIIVWGVAKLIEYLPAREPGDARPAFLSGGEVALLILLAFVLIGFVFHDRIHDRYPTWGIALPALHHTEPLSNDLAPQYLPAGAHVVLDLTGGGISVQAVDGDELHVTASEIASGDSDAEAEALLEKVDVAIDHTNDTFTVHPVSKEDIRGRFSADLDVQIPKTANLVAHTAHGNISISGGGGNIEVRADNGDVEVHGAHANVGVAMQKGDARITGVAGNLRIAGSANDVEIADVMGDVTLNGTFLGSTSVSRVGQITHYTSPRADITVGQMGGRLEVDSDDIAITNAAGPAKIVSQNKDIKVANVAGRLDVNNSHGDITAEYATPPRNDVNITNDSADVELLVPAQSGFEISAFARSGDADSEFEAPLLKTASDNHAGQIVGKVGNPGPRISINTTYGTIHLRKHP
jgi:DUF4097 and DUF4098 domain-containing protein YvlB